MPAATSGVYANEVLQHYFPPPMAVISNIAAGYSEFKDQNGKSMSPRDYLRGKSWDERLRVGKDALILFGVLKP